MLLIQNLTIKVRENESREREGLTIKTTEKFPKTILQNFGLKIKSGIVGITGQNGSGKSTLAKVITGIESENLQITGKIEWENEGQNVNLLNLNIFQKAQLGIFLAFQNPPIIKGISTLNLLKAILQTKFERENELKTNLENQQKNLTNSSNSDSLPKNYIQNTDQSEAKNNLQRNPQSHENPKKTQEEDYNSQAENSNPGFNSPKTIPNYSKKILNIIKENADKLQIGNLYRQKIENLSGGERKKMEILQLLCLDPSLVILDEVDSGLDESSVILIAGILQEFARTKTGGKLPILLVISHNSHFLELLNCNQIIKIEKSEK